MIKQILMKFSSNYLIIDCIWLHSVCKRLLLAKPKENYRLFPSREKIDHFFIVMCWREQVEF
jgi:hypothetical protein